MERHQFAISLCREAGQLARDYFSDLDALVIDVKGAQDWVSEADRNVEEFIRKRITEDWPDDGIIGEEFPPKTGTSGFDWVIDPIDGTTNFVNGIPAWAVNLACVSGGLTQIGVTYEPNADEMFEAARGQGARLNDKPISVAKGVGLASGSISVGYSGRLRANQVVPVIAELLDRGSIYHRNASGALSLAYVASGRLLGYIEVHMNAWDCLAGQLLISEAGGLVEQQNANEMIRDGGRVIAGPPGVFEELLAIGEAAWQP